MPVAVAKTSDPPVVEVEVVKVDRPAPPSAPNDDEILLEAREVREASSAEGSEALSAGPVVELFRLRNAGYLLQYFSVGLIYGGLPATTYGFFVGYLNVPAHVNSTVKVIITMPWTFKFVIGMVSDTCPILGYRRKPYMVLGWSCCALTLIAMACFLELPPPYWCYDAATGEALLHAPPCNPHASKEGGRFALLMMLAALGYVVADVAADGLTVEFARREPLGKRGRTQTTAYMVRTCGVICASVLVGFGMNGKQYAGSFDGGLSFSGVCALLAVPAALMVPVSWLLVPEPRQPAEPSMRMRAYLSVTWGLLRSRAMLHVVLFQFFVAMISQISTPAVGPVKRYWAGVQNLQSNLFSIAGNLLFVLGLSIVKRHLLGADWRVLLLSSQLVLQALDMPLQLCTAAM